MTAHPHSFVGVYDDAATRIMGAAYQIACAALDADGDDALDCALRCEIAAALLEAADQDLRDAPSLAQAAVELVYVDAIEIDFT
jgi:hypothetical protein